MPHGIEYIVRPFQSPGSLGTIIIPATPKETAEQAHIIWGAVGTMPSVKLINPNTVVNTKNEVLDENDRDNDRIRITGSDGESYIDVDRARKVRLTKNETDTSQNLSSTSFYNANGTFDPKLDPYLHNFAGLATNTPKNSGPIGVTWNLKNP